MIRLDPERPHIGASPGWAHMIGAVSLSPPDAGRIDLAERIEIEDLISCCCWARDERRSDALAACLTEDAVWEGSVTGASSLGPVVGRDRILTWQREGWRLDSGQCRHLPLNTTFLGHSEKRAATASYLLLAESRQDVFGIRCSGFLRLDHVRTADGWRIAHLFFGWDAPPWSGRQAVLTDRERSRHGLEIGEMGDPEA